MYSVVVLNFASTWEAVICDHCSGSWRNMARFLPSGISWVFTWFFLLPSILSFLRIWRFPSISHERQICASRTYSECPFIANQLDVPQPPGFALFLSLYFRRYSSSCIRSAAWHEGFTTSSKPRLLIRMADCLALQSRYVNQHL